MPIYEYTCKDCENHFEKLVRMSDANPDITCPNCGSRRVQKSFSLFGVGAGKAGGAAASAGSCNTAST